MPGPALAPAAAPALPDEILDAIHTLKAFGAQAPAKSTWEFGSAEKEAIKLLYARYARDLVKTANDFLRDEAEAWAIVHDVFMQLPWSLRTYQPGNFHGWLKRGTSWLALQARRKSHRRVLVPIEEAAESGSDEVSDTEFDTLERLVKEERLGEVRKATDQLPEHLREVLILRATRGLKHQQIAELLEISVNLSQVRYCRAVKELRRLLSASDV